MSELNQNPLEEQTEKKSNKILAELWDWAKSVIGAMVLVSIVFIFVICPIKVDGSSMEPTLHHEDRLIAYKLMYNPKPGDIVILDENSGLGTALVKRVIAVEGQTVTVTEDGRVKVDGITINEPYILEPHTEYNTGVHNYPVEVPEGCIFVMGDNRNHSTDSRFEPVGFVSKENVIGKVIFRFFPFSNIGLVD